MDEDFSDKVFELVTDRIGLKMTKSERQVLEEAAKEEGDIELINVVRRALRYYLQNERGMKLPDAVFADRKPGNRLPKPKGKENRPFELTVGAV